jgi:hypothetical protein
LKILQADIALANNWSWQQRHTEEVDWQLEGSSNGITKIT